jgi:Uma2 family endonuclease
MSRDPLRDARGPFHADQLPSGSAYELSNGHPVRCMPTGGRGALATGAGYKALVNDPAVEAVGIDAGFSPVSDTLRAPDLSVGKIADAPGWVHGVPRLAVEYADTGQDEDKLAEKIADLLGAGTELVWVVRLDGPRRVEVHAPERAVRKVLPGETLEAPGILARPVPVEALYDRGVADEIDFRNVLRRLTGHESLDAVRDEGKAEGRAEGKAAGRAEGKAEAVLSILEARGVTVSDSVRARILGCSDLPTLETWLRRAVDARSADEVVADRPDASRSPAGEPCG